ncbi:MAG: cupin domain-containing protein [Candidatus Cyclobacteriaceae bacterium M3_2C_046]
MIKFIQNPSIVKAAGNKPKAIEEYFGRINSQSGQVSIARMVSPAGWKEPGQTPEFDEYTVVLKGRLNVETKQQTYELEAGQAILVGKGEWVKYSTPSQEGAEYVAVCLPAFSPDTVNREED